MIRLMGRGSFVGNLIQSFTIHGYKPYNIYRRDILGCERCFGFGF